MVMIEKEEQLKFFLEMRSAEDKSCDNALLHKESKDLDLRPDFGNFQSGPISKIKSSLPSPKIPPDEFLNSENEKSDYNWLLTPPGTPLIPSMEVEPQKDETSKNDMPSFHPTALKQKVINIQAEPASKRTMASKPTSIQSEILNHPKATRKPSLSGGAGSAVLRTSTPTLAKTTKPSRPASPTSQTNFPSAKSVAPIARSSTPTRVAARSSTPTTRPSSAFKLTSRSGTPTRGPSTAADCSDLSGRSRRTSSASKSRTTLSCNSGPLRGTSPTVKARPFKQAEIHDLSNDSVPNLKVTLDESPVSYSKEKPREPNLSSLTGRSNGNPRRQLSSPFRRGPSNGNSYCGGKLFPTMQRSRPSDDDEVNPVLIGSQMVERVVNMRKLAPPERDDHQSNLGNSAPRTADSSGFGRTLSKTSLDMALRHMVKFTWQDITRSIPVKFCPVVTNIRASSLHDDSSSLEKSGAGSAVDSPLATSNDGSSEPSVSHNSICVDGKDIEDNDYGAINCPLILRNSLNVSCINNW